MDAPAVSDSSIKDSSTTSTSVSSGMAKIPNDSIPQMVTNTLAQVFQRVVQTKPAAIGGNVHIKAIIQPVSLIPILSHGFTHASRFACSVAQGKQEMSPLQNNVVIM